MKPHSIRMTALAIVSSAALASAIAAVPAFAAAGDPAAAPQSNQAPGMHDGMRHGRDGMNRGMNKGMMGPFLMAVHKLDLTAQQHQSIRSLLDGAHQARKAQMQNMGENLVVLGNPGDPGYPAAIQSAKDKAANMIQQRSDLDTQIYAVLTADQKAKLPTVLADMQSKLAQRKAQWQQHRSQSAAPQS